MSKLVLTRSRGTVACLLTEIDEVVRNPDLGSDITELAHDSQEQIGLCSKRPNIFIADFVLLETHVGIGDFRHRCQIE